MGMQLKKYTTFYYMTLGSFMQKTRWRLNKNLWNLFRQNSLKEDLSIDTTFDPCYFSWDSTFKLQIITGCNHGRTLEKAQKEMMQPKLSFIHLNRAKYPLQNMFLCTVQCPCICTVKLNFPCLYMELLWRNVSGKFPNFKITRMYKFTHRWEHTYIIQIHSGVFVL